MQPNIDQKTIDSVNGDISRAWILHDRYLSVGEYTIEDICKRFKNELPQSLHEGIDKYISTFDFVPGGRILRALGTNDNLTLFNCLSMPAPIDSLIGKDGIMDRLSSLAVALKKGAGVGLDLSTLRAEGMKLSTCEGWASGPVSFMKLFSDLVSTVMQGGTRRGALLLSMEENHPDIKKFIYCKNNYQDDIRYANISVKLKDINNPILDDISKCAWGTGEPGILFINNILEDFAPQYMGYPFEGVNACSEIPLPAWGVCCLGAININNFVDYYGILDSTRLELVASFAVKFLNSIIDYAVKNNSYPFDISMQTSLDTRQIGIGVMGVAHALFKMGFSYGSEESIFFIKKLMKDISLTVWDTSAEMGYNSTDYMSVYDKISDKSNQIKWVQHIKKYMNDENFALDNLSKFKAIHVINSTLLSGQPTGTTSILAGTTSGIEPLFALSYVRNDLPAKLMGAEGATNYNGYQIDDPVYNKLKNERAPDVFRCAHQIPWLERLYVQQMFQKYMDNSISSTINLPETMTPMEVKYVFKTANNLNLKSITVFRENCRRDPVLISNNCKTGSCDI